MFSTNAILGLLTETSLHAGTGQTLGVVDLAIQREAHTHWPCVYGSAVKGALRTRAESVGLADIDLIFGRPNPKLGESVDYAGALLVGDARLLLLPVRSLTTHFRWVTCPAVLRRYQRDLTRLGLASSIDTFDVPELAETETPEAIALVTETTTNRHLFLEEYRFETKTTDLSTVIAALAKLLPDGMEEDLKAQLTLVSNDSFRHLAEYATPVNAHVRLTDQKTVDARALWYEETLPPETLLYVALNAVPARANGAELQATDVLARIGKDLFGQHPYLQLGGNETVGMGW